MRRMKERDGLKLGEGFLGGAPRSRGNRMECFETRKALGAEEVDISNPKESSVKGCYAKELWSVLVIKWGASQGELKLV